MGNNYCCAYTERPAEDFTIEKNNINISLKFYGQQGKNGRDSVASSNISESSEAHEFYQLNRYLHMNGLGSDPNQMIDFDSI